MGNSDEELGRADERLATDLGLLPLPAVRYVLSRVHGVDLGIVISVKSIDKLLIGKVKWSGAYSLHPLQTDGDAITMVSPFSFATVPRLVHR